MVSGQAKVAGGVVFLGPVGPMPGQPFLTFFKATRRGDMAPRRHPALLSALATYTSTSLPIAALPDWNQ